MQLLSSNGQRTVNLAHTINVSNTTPVEQSSSLVLPVGSQQKAVQAAKLAKEIGAPINRLLTIRTQAMRDTANGGIFRLGTQPECVRIFLDKHLRWMKHRNVPVAYIWSREYSRHPREHFHMGYHQVDDLDADYIEQIAAWCEEEIKEQGSNDATVAQSVFGSWNIRRCIKGGTSGTNIAAYLTKAEPNEITTKWGKVKPNNHKPRQSHHGGDGPIEGNGKHAYRWGTSTLIGRTQRDRHGYGS